MAHDTVRTAQVAGSFYPDDPAVLRETVVDMLACADARTTGGRPLMLVEPHAGFIYSGVVAAHGYNVLKGSDITTVVVVGPSHVEYFGFVSVFDGTAYETPLGRLEVDQAVVDAIVSGASTLRRSHHGHVQPDLPRKEHGLEVQLPFLQTVLGDVSIVPIVMGDQSWEHSVALGEALAPLLERRDTLVIASSDLSHFYSYADARTKDARFCELLQEMDPWQLHESVRTRECEACGVGPIVAGLIAARSQRAVDCQILYSANSGDVTGDHSSVVGYMSAVVRDLYDNVPGIQ